MSPYFGRAVTPLIPKKRNSCCLDARIRKHDGEGEVNMTAGGGGKHDGRRGVAGGGFLLRAVTSLHCHTRPRLKTFKSIIPYFTLFSG